MALYLAVTLPGLTRYPAVWVDEGWIAEVAAQVAHGHAPGNPSHGELFRYNDRLFWMPPLYFLGLGGWFALSGVTLPAARLFNVLLGGATLWLLFRALRSRTNTTAAFAAGLLAMTDTFVWKVHRTVRFESMMGGLVLLLFLTVLRALEREDDDEPAGRAWLAAGGVAGLAMNVHPNAALFVAAAGLIVIWRRRTVRRSPRGPLTAAAVALGLVLPWVLYCLSDAGAGFANLRGQNSFHLHHGGGPARALLAEWRRWTDWFAWPWRTPLVLVWGTVLVRALRRSRVPEIGAGLIMLGAPVTFYCFLPNKTLLYLAPVAWLVAFLAGWLWWSGRRPIRIVLLAAIALNLAVDGGLLWRSRSCRTMNDLATIRAGLGPGDRVAGTFVTWWAAQPRPFHEFSRGATLDAVHRFDPTVIILGDRQWQNEVRTRFAPLAGALSAPADSTGAPPGPLAGRAPVLDLSGSCLGNVLVYRLRDP